MNRYLHYDALSTEIVPLHRIRNEILDIHTSLDSYSFLRHTYLKWEMHMNSFLQDFEILMRWNWILQDDKEFLRIGISWYGIILMSWIIKKIAEVRFR